MKKSQRLELAFHYLPPKKFKTNKAAAEFNAEILRLSIKHWTLNPIELAWAGLRKHFRKYNIYIVCKLPDAYF